MEHYRASYHINLASNGGVEMTTRLSRIIGFVRSLLALPLRMPQYQPDVDVRIYPHGRDQFKCCIGDRCAYIYAEMCAGEVNYAIDKASPSAWLPPHADEPMNREDRERMLRNLCKYLDHAGRTYRIT